MRVYLSAFLYRPNIGGVENSLFNLSNEFIKLGYNVTILTTNICKDTDDLPLYEVMDGASIYRYKWIKCLSRIFFINYIINVFYLVFFIKKKVIEKEDLIICRHHFMAIAFYFAGYRNIKYIVPEVIMKKDDLSISFKHKILMWVNFRIQKAVVLNLNKLFVFSDNVVNQFKELGINVEFNKLYPGVDDEKFKPNNKILLREKYGISLDSYVYLGIGRFIKTKSFDLCINAFACTKKNNDKLVLVGDGVEKNNYAELVKQLELQNDVLFFDSTSVPEEFYCLADVFLMTSINEAFGQTILESISCKLPFIYFKNGRYGDIIVKNAVEEILTEDSTCALSARFSIEDLSLQMKKIKEIKEFDFPDISKFNWSIMAETLIKDSL